MAVISIPSLTALLLKAEWRKGAPLTQEEVETIRGKTLTVQIPDNIVRYMDFLCGVGDVAPQNSGKTD